MPSSTSSSESDPFGVLGVTPSATPAEIRAAYLALAARYHPDQHHGNPLEELANARMAEINRAYAILSEPVRRAGYTTGAHARAERAATDRQTRTRFFKGAALLLAVPLVFRTGAILIRVIGALLQLLVEATASLRGPRLAAGAGLIAVVVLAFALRRRPPR
jgi:DnaJ-domain-containing protein 1